MSGSTYSDAGVDLAGVAKIKEQIVSLCASTHNSRVVDMEGFFAGAYEFPCGSESLIVVSTDSVGTKVRLGIACNSLKGLGHDLVAHCVNDILTTGAEPLLFLDYIGIGEVNNEVINGVLSGLTEACKDANCALIGGETAILSGVYRNGDFDLVGFVVGSVTRDRLIGPDKVSEGNVLIGVPSDGLHTNGYSLARKVMGTDDDPSILSRQLSGFGETLGEVLLKPHKSYLGVLRPVLRKIQAMSHITGGGITENLPRVLPVGLVANIDMSSWEVPPIFRLIQSKGEIAEDEMLRVFNMGVGMILVVEPSNADEVLSRVQGSWSLGSVVSSEGQASETIVYRYD